MFITDLIGGIFGFLGGSSQAAALQEAAEMNYEMDTENAAVRRDMSLASLKTQRMGQRVGYLSTAMNLNTDLQRIAAKNRNAKRIRETVEYNTKKDREGLSRQSEQFDRLLSTQQATVGLSGVTTEGAPMEVMTDTVEQFQKSLADMHDQATYQRAAGLQEAVNMEFEAKWEKYLNHFNRRQFKRKRKLEGFANWLGRTSARQQFRSDMMQAEIDYKLAQVQAQAQQSSALSSGLQDIGAALFGEGSPFAGFFS